MAAPSYTTDLTTLAIGSITVDGGSWDESSDAGWDDAGAMVDDGNLYYNGSACVSAQFTKDGVGTIMYEHTAAITVPTDGAVLIHHLWAAPPALGLLVDGGVRVIVGNGLGVFKAWKASGRDAAPAPKGGWYQYAIDPSLTEDYLVGTVASPYDTFGIAVSATAQARGNPNACNAIRYGRCEAVYTLGESATPAVFSGFAALDNATSAKWGLLQDVEGGYKCQGLMSFGTSGTAVYFKDANTNITIENTINVSANFNKIEINNAGSYFEWNAVSISALGTVSKGRFEVVDNADVNKTSCTFTDMDSFIYQSNSTILSTIHRRCGLITQGGATMTAGTVDQPSGTVGISASNLNAITKYNFNSAGTGHAVDLGTVSSNTSLSWDNTDTGYTAASSGNETIVVSVDNGVTLTINVAGGASTPSVYNTGTGTVDVVSGLVSFSFSVEDQDGNAMTGYEWRLYDNQGVSGEYGTELDGEEVAGASSQTYSYTYTADDGIVLQVMKDGYIENRTNSTLTSSDQDLTIIMKTELN